MIRKTAILVVVLLAAFLCIASLSPFALAQPCDHNVTVNSVICGPPTHTEGWFHNATGWYELSRNTPLFNITVDGVTYNAFCHDLDNPLNIADTFNASIYAAEPTCRNNSMAHILNNWTYSDSDCPNVSAAQSAIWYFRYVNNTVCISGSPNYNHTANESDPGWESRWIPNCTAHSEACTFINTSINKSVPYDIELKPSVGSYVQGTPIELEATVSYCLGDVEVVTVVFETDAGNFSDNSKPVFENDTINGKCNATLVCDPSVGSVNVTARVKDMKWFEIVVPCNGYQETLRIINITDDANFSYSEGTRDIGIEKWVDGVNKLKEVRYNQTVTYTLNITNTGAVNLTSITVVDTLPADITWADEANITEDNVTWYPNGTTRIVWKNNLTQFEPLQPGQSFEILFNATINEDAECDKIYRNLAVVNATSEWGDVGPKSSHADVFIVCHKVPLLTPFGIAALIGLLSLVVVYSMSKSMRRKKG